MFNEKELKVILVSVLDYEDRINDLRNPDDDLWEHLKITKRIKEIIVNEQKNVIDEHQNDVW